MLACSPEGALLPPVRMPGVLLNAAETCTSIFGTVYDARALTPVIQGSSRWQYCVGSGGCTTTGEPAGVPPAFGGLYRSISGSCEITPQLSVTVCPVPMPPCKRRPSLSRAFTLMSKPFQCSFSVPYLSDSVLRYWV